ncbi:phage portal protein family protein [Limisalsivibrio acetivorans]|uniref:phage portal protein family protein n=1 Tax=Limisalsivibrio acetivorans TaxID=1304888 RepID=UPI0003B68992|nr:DUF935 family protein [Limisalsivibrio acetivorans]
MKKLTTAVTGPAGIGSVLGYMPNPDTVLSGGVRMETFAQMMNDAHISAKVEQLKEGVLSGGWSIAPADQGNDAVRTAEMVRRAVEGINGFRGDLEEILSAVEYGFSVTEIVWKREGGLMLPEKLLGRKQERFGFNSEGGLLMDGASGSSVIDEEYKVIVHRHSPRGENPYGSPILSKCYWPWMFKKAGFRFWLTAAEKYGVPTVLALFDSIDDEDARRRAASLAESLSGIQNDAALAMANVDKVEVLESRGTSADFSELINLCNAEISKAVTGEILTSDTSAGGSWALAREHSKTYHSRAEKLAVSLADTLNSTLIRWITELNAGKGVPVPVFSFEWGSSAEWEVVSDAIKLGVPVDIEEIGRRFGIPLINESLHNGED